MNLILKCLTTCLIVVACVLLSACGNGLTDEQERASAYCAALLALSENQFHQRLGIRFMAKNADLEIDKAVLKEGLDRVKKELDESGAKKTSPTEAQVADCRKEL